MLAEAFVDGEEEGVVGSPGTAGGGAEIVGGGEIGDAGAGGLLRGEIDDAGIQGKEKVVAAAVEGKLLDLLLADQAGDVVGGGADDRGIGDNRKSHFHRFEQQAEIDLRFLADDEVDAGAKSILEAGLGDANFVFGDGKRKHEVAAGVIGEGVADSAGFEILGRDGSRGDWSAGRVGDEAGDADGELCAGGWRAGCSTEDDREEQHAIETHDNDYIRIRSLGQIDLIRIESGRKYAICGVAAGEVLRASSSDALRMTRWRRRVPASAAMPAGALVAFPQGAE